MPGVETGSDFEAGSLSITSFVRPLKLFTASATIIEGRAGIVRQSTVRLVTTRIIAALHTGG